VKIAMPPASTWRWHRAFFRLRMLRPRWFVVARNVRRSSIFGPLKDSGKCPNSAEARIATTAGCGSSVPPVSKNRRRAPALACDHPLQTGSVFFRPYSGR
jgi:hypothetical protein